MQKRPAHVVIADKRIAERDAGFFREAEGGPIAAIGHRDDDIAGHRMLPGQFPAEFDADLSDVLIEQIRVGTSEVDVFENAECVRLTRAGPRIDGANAVFVDDHDFAGFDIADVLGLNQIEGARFAGEHVGGAGGTAVGGRCR